MKIKPLHWEIVLFIFANLICAINYILPILLIAGLFMLADLATTPGNSIRAFNFIYFLFTLVYLLGKNFVIWFVIFIICKFGREKYKSIAQNFKTPTKIWAFVLAITVIIDILTLLYLKNMAFANILSLSGFTFAYLTAFILFAIEKRIKKHAKISQYQ